MSAVSTSAEWTPNIVARSQGGEPRRAAAAVEAPAGGWEFGAFRLLPCGTLMDRSGVVALTPKEEGVLRVLVAAEGRRLSKETILQAVWGDADVTEGSLTRAAHTLRCRLGERRGGPTYIGTSYGRGYQVRVPVRRLD
jgi:DNA-binding winged helix-turn-helix (wHTH) protein